MYPHPTSLNPINVAEGGSPLVSAWGQQFAFARNSGMIHRTFLVALYKPHDNLMWPPRDGIQRYPMSAKPSLPRYSYGYPGPVLLGPADQGLY
jgi:hypothetical protein